MNLALRTLATTVVGLVVLGALLFVPAGTLAYGPGWAFIVVFTLLTNGIGVYLALEDPELLQRRMRGGPTAETRPVQCVLIAVIAVAVLATPVVAALDWRLDWSRAPVAVIVLGDVLVALGLAVTFVVLLQNRYAASAIRIMAGQTLVSTGLYGVVRHPMYLGALILVIGEPLALGSYWGLLVLLVVVPALALRIADEEDMLANELPGYRDYRHAVRYRLVPGIW
jgi:protein-S-isoprenylcysteine O-methyltransferase Ste14